MQHKVDRAREAAREPVRSIAEQLKQAQVSDEQLRGDDRVARQRAASTARAASGARPSCAASSRRPAWLEHVDFDTADEHHHGCRRRPPRHGRPPARRQVHRRRREGAARAYIEASQIPVTATGEEGARREPLSTATSRRVRGHIDALAKKTYWEGLDASPEFVIAFIPSESLLSSALEADPAILEYAFGKRVALASPVTLWAVLKTVAFTWQQQALTDEAKKLFDLGKDALRALGTLSRHADRLRKAIERTVDSYNKFANSLETRVLVTARQFPGIDETKSSSWPSRRPSTSAPRSSPPSSYGDVDSPARCRALDVLELQDLTELDERADERVRRRCRRSGACRSRVAATRRATSRRGGRPSTRRIVPDSRPQHDALGADDRAHARARPATSLAVGDAGGDEEGVVARDQVVGLVDVVERRGRRRCRAAAPRRPPGRGGPG